MSTEYATRANAFSRETRYVLTLDALEMHQGETVIRLPYDEVKHVRLQFDPTRVEPNRYRAWITAKRGITIQSTRYLSFGDFEDQADAYKAFMESFLHELEGTDAVLVSGNTWLGWFAGLGCMVFGLGVAGLAVVFYDGNIGVKGGLLLLYLVMGAGYLRSNFPQTFSPTDPPKGTLP